MHIVCGKLHQESFPRYLLKIQTKHDLNTFLVWPKQYVKKPIQYIKVDIGLKRPPIYNLFMLTFFIMTIILFIVSLPS